MPPGAFDDEAPRPVGSVGAGERPDRRQRAPFLGTRDQQDEARIEPGQQAPVRVGASPGGPKDERPRTWNGDDTGPVRRPFGTNGPRRHERSQTSSNHADSGRVDPRLMCQERQGGLGVLIGGVEIGIQPGAEGVRIRDGLADAGPMTSQIEAEHHQAAGDQGGCLGGARRAAGAEGVEQEDATDRAPLIGAGTEERCGEPQTIGGDERDQVRPDRPGCTPIGLHDAAQAFREVAFHLARVSRPAFASEAPDGGAQIGAGGAPLHVELEVDRHRLVALSEGVVGPGQVFPDDRHARGETRRLLEQGDRERQVSPHAVRPPQGVLDETLPSGWVLARLGEADGLLQDGHRPVQVHSVLGIVVSEGIEQVGVVGHGPDRPFVPRRRDIGAAGAGVVIGQQAAGARQVRIRLVLRKVPHERFERGRPIVVLQVRRQDLLERPARRPVGLLFAARRKSD